VSLVSRYPCLQFGAQAISLERMKLDISNLVCILNVKSTAITHVKVFGKFWEISANISETVQNRHVVTIED